MSQPDPGTVVRGRDHGLRRIGRLSWRAGLAGLVAALVLTLAFGHHASASAQGPKHDHNSGTIVIPAQPPAPAAGGGQVVSGAS
jgi:hypothetical protein